MGVYTDIETALNTRLRDLVGIENVAWPNVEFPLFAGEQYYRPILLPAATSLYALNRLQQHRGIYQINVYVPLNKGMQFLYSLLDELETHFSSNMQLQANDTVVFLQSSGIGPSERQDTWYEGNISINYLCYK